MGTQHRKTTTIRRSRRTGSGERTFMPSGREGDHRLQVPHSRHLLKVAWESIG